MSPVFTGLTRPPMIFGITLDYLCWCLMTSLGLFILGDSVGYFITYVPLHLVGWMACKMDPHIFRIFLKSLACTYCPNQKLWGCKAYEPF